jgi:predicted small lipoprotein YifL
MKKMFAVALLLSASLAACGSKKESTTPKAEPAMEQKSDATGGAAYGKKADAPPPADDKASPNAPK